MTPPPGYLAGVREICDRYGIVFVLDEVMAGFGRTGAWFAADHFDVVPDLLTFAKGVNSGYVPLGGVAISAEIAATFETRPYPGGLTYCHPLACAAAVATIGVMEDEKVVENAARIGETVLGPGLRELAERHPSVGEVRGLGAFWALDLVRNRETREPLVPYNASGEANAPMAAFGAAAKKQGLWPFINMNRTRRRPRVQRHRGRGQGGSRGAGHRPRGGRRAHGVSVRPPSCTSHRPRRARNRARRAPGLRLPEPKMAEAGPRLSTAKTADEREGSPMGPSGGVTRSTLRQQIADALRDEVLAGRLRPGREFTVKQIAEQYGVSATPVREALFDLSAQGLLASDQHRGFQVREFTIRDYRAMVEARSLVVEGIFRSPADQVAVRAEALAPIRRRAAEAAPRGEGRRPRRTDPRVRPPLLAGARGLRPQPVHHRLPRRNSASRHGSSPCTGCAASTRTSGCCGSAPRSWWRPSRAATATRCSR
ncbi:Adenosylmethionine-8-amino-7-oxononanoate aminotransferase [Streptomyces microflavus]